MLLFSIIIKSNQIIEDCYKIELNWMLIVMGKDPLLKARIDQIKTTNNLDNK